MVEKECCDLEWAKTGLQIYRLALVLRIQNEVQITGTFRQLLCDTVTNTTFPGIV